MSGTIQTMNYEDLVYQRCVDFFRSFDAEVHPDVYVFALGHEPSWMSEPLPPNPFAPFGDQAAIYCPDAIFTCYNTLSNWRTQIPEASDERQAKWNPAFWVLEDSQEIAPCAIEELSLRDEWCSTLGVPVIEQAENGRPIYGGEELTRASMGVCRRALEKIHAAGWITEKFGRAVPILIMYYEGALALQSSIAANPHSDELQEVIENQDEFPYASDL